MCPLSRVANANPGGGHHVLLPWQVLPRHHPDGIILSQVPLVKSLVDAKSLAQLGGPIAELPVLEQPAGGFPGGPAQLPHGVQALQGFQGTQQHRSPFSCAQQELGVSMALSLGNASPFSPLPAALQL